jgi:hypothetical protein
MFLKHIVIDNRYSADTEARKLFDDIPAQSPAPDNANMALEEAQLLLN